MLPSDQLQAIERLLGRREEQLKQEIAVVRQRSDEPVPGAFGDAIDPRHLLAQPPTPRCRPCQAAMERASPATTVGGPPARRS